MSEGVTGLHFLMDDVIPDFSISIISHLLDITTSQSYQKHHPGVIFLSFVIMYIISCYQISMEVESIHVKG